MKTKITLLAAFIGAFFASFAQQVPNGSFETWTNTYTPTGWVGWEDILNGQIPVTFPPDVWTFKDTTTYTDGVASVKIVSDSISGHKEIFNGLISLGSVILQGDTLPVFSGIPFTYRPDSIVFDYQYITHGSDTAAVFMTLTLNGNQVLGHLGAHGFTHSLFKTTGWTHMAIPITSYYQSQSNPDTMLLQFNASNTAAPINGSTMLVDNVKFGYATPPPPQITAIITPSGLNVCNGDSVLLTANSGINYTYQWNLGGAPILGATLVTYYAKTAGSYTVTIDSATLTGTSTAVVITANCNTSPGLTATITATGSNVCNGDSVLLAANTGNSYTYQWNIGGTPILGATTANYYAKTPGSYTIIIDSSTATATSSAFIVTDTGCVSGISNIAAADFAIYPNPASTLLNINSTVILAGAALQVYDLVGRVVISQVLTGTNNAVDVAKLANGTYIYRIADKENNVVTQNKFTVIK